MFWYRGGGDVRAGERKRRTLWVSACDERGAPTFELLQACGGWYHLLERSCSSSVSEWRSETPGNLPRLFPARSEITLNAPLCSCSLLICPQLQLSNNGSRLYRLYEGTLEGSYTSVQKSLEERLDTVAVSGHTQRVIIETHLSDAMLSQH